jgi:hypothetical protein
MTRLSKGSNDLGMDRKGSLATAERKNLLSQPDLGYAGGGFGLTDEELHAVTGGESKPKGGLAGG